MSFIKAGVNAALAYMTAGAGSTTGTAGTSSAFVGGSRAAAESASLASRTGMSGVSSSINANGSLNFARLF